MSVSEYAFCAVHPWLDLVRMLTSPIRFGESTYLEKLHYMMF